MKKNLKDETELNEGLFKIIFCVEEIFLEVLNKLI